MLHVEDGSKGDGSKQDGFPEGAPAAWMLSIPSRSCVLCFQKPPSRSEDVVPIDKGKHEGNAFLQPEYVELSVLFFLLQSTSLEDKIKLPPANLTPTLWPEETSALHGRLGCPG